MPDYQKSIIYEIKCNDETILEKYIGSTTNLICRNYAHKTNCYNEKKESYNFKVYKFIRENGGLENWSIIKIKDYPCNNKKELYLEEGKYIKELEYPLNKVVPGRTRKETSSAYAENNKDECRVRRKKYNDKNKELLLAKHREYNKKNREIINQKSREVRKLKNKNHVE